MIKVKVFVDYSNFRGAWNDKFGVWKKENGGRDPSSYKSKMDWERFPERIEENLFKAILSKPASSLDFRGVNIYASIGQGRPALHQEDQKYWMLNTLDQFNGFTVKVYHRHPIELFCSRERHLTTRSPERGIDTKIVCDMLSWAMRDLCDVCVLVSEDADLIPAVEVLQDVMDRRVVHVGFKGRGEQLRAASWSHLYLDDLISASSAPPDTITPPVPEAGTAS